MTAVPPLQPTRLLLPGETRPWDSEPDARTWIDEASGYRCGIERSKVGQHLIAWVVVPLGHPAYGLRSHNALIQGLSGSCHRGITITRPSTASAPQVRGSKPTPGWLLGFDGAHEGDLMPRYGRRSPRDVYRGWGYMKSQLRQLTQALWAMDRVAQNQGLTGETG